MPGLRPAASPRSGLPACLGSGPAAAGEGYEAPHSGCYFTSAEVDADTRQDAGLSIRDTIFSSYFMARGPRALPRSAQPVSVAGAGPGRCDPECDRATVGPTAGGRAVEGRAGF